MSEVYAAIRAINWSTLKWLSVSALMYQWMLTHPEPQKEAFVFGGAVHCKVLEPEHFDSRYVVFDGDRRQKNAWKEFQEEHADLEILRPEEMRRINMVHEAVFGDGGEKKGHRVAKELLRGGRREEAVTWIDADTGLACKGRLDYIRPDLFLDLKTTRDPAPSAMERAADKYGYNGQCAFYHDGAVAARRIDGNQRPYVIALQSVPPFDVACFQLGPDALSAGRHQYKTLLQKLLLCTKADFWPGVAPDLVQLGLPPWHGTEEAIETESEDF